MKVPRPSARRRAVGEIWVSVTETLLRMLPFPSRTGLQRIGDPGPDSPVVLTCNFRLTVQRVRRALAGLDAWLLVANSRGVNVWCAATGGLLTDHDVVSVLKTSGIAEVVDHRRVMLPQLAATGIDARTVRRRSGWQVVWGPIEATDIPRFLASEPDSSREPTRPETRAMRTVTFPLRRRLEMAVAWAFPISIATLVLLVFRPSAVVPAIGLVWALAVAVYASFPLYRRWLHATTRRSFGRLKVDAGQLALVIVFWTVVLGVWLTVAGPTGHATVAGASWWGLGSLLVLVLLGVDLSGSTPVYKSGLHSDRLLAIILDTERCTGAAFCAQVCPKDVFEIDHDRRTAVVAHSEECVQCGACIVQCPFDALTFTAPDGAVVAPEVVRKYKLNLLGTRSRPSESTIRH